METAQDLNIHSVNLGVFDGEVGHVEINHALTLAPRVILFGEQTRLPYFPDDTRLPKLHASDPLVLLFWKVLKKIPDNLRYALIESQLSITLIRGENLLFYDNYRRHQAVHIGRRRHKGLRGYFVAYRQGETAAQDLVHALWMYLCSLSSDAAGVFSRLGCCRAWGRGDREEEEFERALCGILVRLDKAPNYAELSAEVTDMGEVARNELAELIEQQQLEEEDEWEVFKGKKQMIVARACELLEQLQGGGEDRGQVQATGIDLHQDEIVVGVLQDSPHRHTSDPSAVLMYVRNYERSLKDFGPGDPDTGFLLACVLIRLDCSEHYEYLLEQVPRLGTSALSAMYSVFDQIPERDMKRRTILKEARIRSAQMLAQTQALARRNRAR